MAQIKKINGTNETYINKNMVVSIVSLATKEIQGVVDVYQPTRLSIKRLFNRNVGKGVKIKYTNLGVLIDIYVVVETDVEVNDIVYRIQQNIKNSLTTLLPIKIKAINVHIMDAVKKS
ncbi:MAG TPA: Asp23/Gls24 family envelope stress response protein [Candidatus Onthoplasma faecipullorum]|nr:Asp23/Gls24 family envelope stress response protein [Candidatus Onthoplasma faecipullorum]